MATSTITSKHQTTVPKDVRERLRLEAGAVLYWEVRGRAIRVTAEPPPFFALRGSIRVGRGSVVADLSAARARRGLERW